MSSIKFSKMVATGNDFVVVDNRRPQTAGRKGQLARFLCNRKSGVGADGLLLLEKSRKADFKMRIFNPDGSEPGMCGNGSRCIALYARAHKIADSDMRIETKAGLLSAKVNKNRVRMNMMDPKNIKLGIGLEIDKKPYELHHINTGVPHAVYFVKSFDKIDIFWLGRSIRYHKIFKPAGCNADFVQAKGKNALFIRTYERGVEAETLACGTGAAASAIISSIMKGFKSPVKVYAKGGLLYIYFKKKGNRFSDIFLEGEAKEAFEGRIRRPKYV